MSTRQPDRLEALNFRAEITRREFPPFYQRRNPMTLSERVEKEYIDAYKAKESDKVGALRLLKSAIKNRLVELKRINGSLSDDELIDIIKKQVKQCRDSMEQFARAGRDELARKEKSEIEILETYLPETMGEEEMTALIDRTIKEVGAASPRDIGKVLGKIMGEHKSRVDGKVLSEAVKKRLSSL